MKRVEIQQNSSEWLDWRKSRITGSKLKNLIVKRGNGRKVGFYEILAERLSMDTSEVENPMERGHDLELEAIKEFSERTGHDVKTDCGVWVSDENEYITISPDGEIDDEHAVEVKCLSSANHLKAYVEKEIPTEYKEQAVQYFIVNEKLEQLYFVFYDPRITCLPLHYIIINREDIETEIESYKQYELDAIEEINRLVSELTF